MAPDDRHDRPGHHDPFAGVGGAAPAQSALSLRLVLAVMALFLCVGAAITFGVVLGGPLWAVALFAVIGLTAAVDIVVVARRKLRGERG